MRLRDLNPTIEPVLKVNGTRHPVMMVPTGDWWLSFYCPHCGKPYSVSILVGDSVRDEVKRRWKVDPLPDGLPDWFDRVTVTPSINFTGVGHGPKKPTCTFHGNITAGLIGP